MANQNECLISGGGALRPSAFLAVVLLLFVFSSSMANTLSGPTLRQDSNADEAQETADSDSTEKVSQDANNDASAANSESGSEANSNEENAQAEQAAKLQAARAEAANSPQQPFFNHWLWLVVLAMSLWGITYIPRSDPNAFLGESSTPLFDFLQRFAFRFTALYFCLFFFPAPFTYLPYLGMWIYPVFQTVDSAIVNWIAENILKINPEWVPYSGSGDSTQAYVRLFSVFGVALVLAIAWTLIDRRKTDYRIMKDLFHSNIAYILALTMLGYGLAKCGYARNQFSIISGASLETTWGDTSPMGALWKFMGASRPYTIFAGLGETVGALLLIFRRTRTLGALVIFGVMANVVMLNFCYDVPVKINSTMLALLALCLILRDSGRLGNILFFNRATEPVDQRPPYTGSRTVWVQRAFKAAVVVMWFAIPLYSHIKTEIEHANRPADPEFFATLGVEEFRVDGELREADAKDCWERIAFQQRKMNANMEPVPTNWMAIKTVGGPFYTHTFEIVDENKLVLTKPPGDNSEVPEELTINKSDNGNWILSGESPNGNLEITLRMFNDSDSALMGRGFRWINEVPFNR